MKLEYIGLYGDLHKEFELNEIENSNFEKQRTEHRENGMSDEEYYELKGGEEYDIYKDQIRRIMWIIDQYIEDPKFKN